ncbi:hypothetical protein N431DRAFT_560440 [Stipitochalara longipes BDJ]|nr:hypothetical protein N431DRAFT_560440 [Stipitochalara longipes BDJ]
MTTNSFSPFNLASTSNNHDRREMENGTAQKGTESGVEVLRGLLGLTSTPRPESINFRPPIFISIPKLSSKTKVELPLNLSILDLLGLSYLPAEKVISTHTFISKLPLCWTKLLSDPDLGKLRTTAVLVTGTLFSLEQLLPPNRDLLFISTNVSSDQCSLSLLLRSLGLTSRNKVLGIIDIDMLAKDVVALGAPSSISSILQRLQSPAEKGCEATEFVMRAMLLLVLENCESEASDEIAKTWVDCLKVVGTGPVLVEGPMDVVKKGVEKVGKAIMGKVKRSKDEIERIKTERRKRRQDTGPSEEYVTEMRLWDGMWELL